MHPPTPRDLSGIHGVLWAALSGGELQLPPDKPLTLVADTAGPVKRAYLEPCAVGDPLAEMPLFLDPELYVNVPLEQTYMEAYRGVPRYYCTILEA